jgi:hypothetical protein
MGYSIEKSVIRYGQRAIMEKKQLQEKYNVKIKKKVYEKRKEKLFSRKIGSTKERRSGGRRENETLQIIKYERSKKV